MMDLASQLVCSEPFWDLVSQHMPTDKGGTIQSVELVDLDEALLAHRGERLGLAIMPNGQDQPRLVFILHDTGHWYWLAPGEAVTRPQLAARLQAVPQEEPQS